MEKPSIDIQYFHESNKPDEIFALIAIRLYGKTYLFRSAEQISNRDDRDNLQVFVNEILNNNPDPRVQIT